jgi:secondary thiamine-phosphate synthase enzyme
MTITEVVELQSQGNFWTFNVTDQVRDVVARSGVHSGSVLVFYQHTTGAVLLIEHEVGMLADLKDVLERLAPLDAEWKHHRRGYDANGGAHVRAALLNSSVAIPIAQGELLLGTFQEIVVADFDPGERERVRNLAIQVAGE